MTYRTLTIQITREDSQWKTIDYLCLLSKHLYNASLYLMRQDFENGAFNLSSQYYNKKLIDSELYCSLSKNSSLQVVQQVHRNFCLFFKANKAFKKQSKKFNGKPQLPRYKHKTKGRNVIRFTFNQFKVKGNELHFPQKCNLKSFKLPHQLKDVKYVEITPHRSHYSISVVYKVTQPELTTDNGHYMSIDLGVNNFATVTTSIDESGYTPFLINGRTAKSINHFYNKVRANLQSKLPKGIKSSKRIDNLTRKRNNKLLYHFHCISKYLVDYCNRLNICKVVIGYNSGWKQGVNLGKTNNQTFCYIPYHKFISLLEYKLANYGIELIKSEENYTSKCSFLDREEICNHQNYLGRRTHRGLFKSSNGTLVNADVNGAYNIMRKVFGDASLCLPTNIGFIGNPMKLSFKC